MREPDSWISLSDFRPGIVHDLAQGAVGAALVGSAPAPDGAASIENTYRCVNLAGGGLGPLPVQDWTYSRPTIAADIPTWRVQALAVGAVKPGHATKIQTVDPRSLATTHLTDFLMAFTAFTAGGTKRTRYYRDRVYQAGPTLAAGDVDLLLSQDDSSTTQTGLYVNATYLAPHAVSVATAPKIQTTTAFGRDNSISGNADIGLQVWPDPTTPGTAQTAAPLTLGIPNGRPISHQGRIVVFFRTGYADGPGAVLPTRETSGDAFGFTIPGSLVQDGSTASFVTADSMTGLGCMASISASDLLLITHTLGAALVQGDIANPTVRRMPGVVGTGGTSCIGVQTPAGFVYGVNRGGIYAWTGGATSTLLSGQLPDDCWIVPSAASIVDYQGRFAFWQNWVMCPGNWVYNLASSSWWRIEDPATFLAYEWFINPVNGYCYGNQPLWTDGGAQMAGYIRGFNRAVGAHSWSWQSQPLARSRNHILSVRDVDLVCQGAGTVAVTFTSADGSTQTKTYTLAGSTSLTQYLRTTFGVVEGGDIKVRFLATGTGGSGVAPVLHACHIGYNERRHVGAG